MSSQGGSGFRSTVGSKDVSDEVKKVFITAESNFALGLTSSTWYLLLSSVPDICHESENSYSQQFTAKW